MSIPAFVGKGVSKACSGHKVMRIGRGTLRLHGNMVGIGFLFGVPNLTSAFFSSHDVKVYVARQVTFKSSTENHKWKSTITRSREYYKNRRGQSYTSSKIVQLFALHLCKCCSCYQVARFVCSLFLLVFCCCQNKECGFIADVNPLLSCLPSTHAHCKDGTSRLKLSRACRIAEL